MDEKENWNKSYSKNENNILYPYEPLVKFLSKIKIGKNKTALDYGCGIGRQTYLLTEFGYKAKGLDISSKVIQKAKTLFKAGKPVFKVCNGTEIEEKQKFDLIICLSVLDSMPFNNAINILAQLSQLSKKYMFLSFKKGEKFRHEIKKDYEKGTHQTYYTWTRIQMMIAYLTDFEIINAYLTETKNLITEKVDGRYFVILKKRRR